MINERIDQPAPTVCATNINQILASMEATAQSRSRLVINFGPRSSLSAEQRRRMSNDAVLQNLIGSHLFVLDDSGVLSLQGLELIPLLGLSEADINRRLAAEPYLLQVLVDARILRQKPIGVEAIKYLNDQIKNTSLAELQNVFFSLIEEQTKTVMLAKVTDEYLLKTLDPAVAPELEAEPERILIVILAHC